MVHYSRCPLCTSEKVKLDFFSKDYFLSLKEFAIFRCSSCTFLFTQDHPEEKDIQAFYESNDYISHSDTKKGWVNKLYQISRNVMLKRKKNLINKISKNRKGVLLDIGSGTGYFADTMKRAGWKVKGIEINEKARNYSISQFGLDVNSPELISEMEPDQFDCITLWHVLEHFHQPFQYFSEIGRILKPGATCVVALPNSSSYDAEFYKEFWAAWDVPRHLWHYNSDTFKIFAEKTGFIIEKTVVLPLDVFYISQLSEKYINGFLPFIKGMFIASYFAVKALFNKEKGSSLIYILRKASN